MLAPTVGQPGASSAPGHLGAAVTLGRKSTVLASCSAGGRAGRAAAQGDCCSDAAPKVGAGAHQAKALIYSSVGNGTQNPTCFVSFVFILPNLTWLMVVLRAVCEGGWR